MAWIAKDIGTQVGTITFQLPTAVTDDGEGGTVDGLSPLTIHVRIKVPSQGSSNGSRLEEVFPGTNSHQNLLLGWVGTRKNHKVYKFPASLRNWPESPIGTLEYQDSDRNKYTGKIEVRVQPFAVEDAAKKIGERFEARFTPD